MRNPDSARIGVIGLGYVGLPLAVAFGREHDTLGFDIDAGRVEALRKGSDSNREVDDEELAAARHLRLSASLDDLRDRDVYVVTVPTPINEHKHPDFTPLIQASREIGAVL
jgi:UDP-N-acetyl-D-galactosamine dehydrogenase